MSSIASTKIDIICFSYKEVALVTKIPINNFYNKSYILRGDVYVFLIMKVSLIFMHFKHIPSTVVCTVLLIHLVHDLVCLLSISILYTTHHPINKTNNSKVIKLIEQLNL